MVHVEDYRHVPRRDLLCIDVKSFFASAECAARGLDPLHAKLIVMSRGSNAGDNLLLSKLALDNEAKHVSSCYAEWHYEDVPQTIWQIPQLEDMWGIGKRMANRLRQVGISSVYSLSQAPVGLLKKHIGVIGEQLYYHAHGIDYAQINDTYTPADKSYGKNQILECDYTDKKK